MHPRQVFGLSLKPVVLKNMLDAINHLLNCPSPNRSVRSSLTEELYLDIVTKQ